MEHYKVPDFHTAPEFLSMLAKRQGKLRKGGLPDTDKAAKSVLMDWTGWVENLTFGSLTNESRPVFFPLASFQHVMFF